MEERNQKWIEEQMALQCAPLFAGLKLSNLLIIPKALSEELGKRIIRTNFCAYCLSSYGEKKIYLLYRRKELMSYLEEKEVRQLLFDLGYTEWSLERLLEQVSIQYTKHLAGTAQFPHELGLLLGYPAVDVRGFMEHEGKDFLYSGYWKVYGNLKETLYLFQEFGKAREFFIRMTKAGYSIAEVAEFYVRRKQNILAAG